MASTPPLTPAAAESPARSDIKTITNVPRALSSVQERRLMDYLDEHILHNQREYKKRNYETSSPRTLPDYLKAFHPLLTLILMIPPVDQSASLRTALLLRLTGELLECVPGYPPDDLPGLLAVLEELDRGWFAIFRSQVWNPESRQGEDLIISADMALTSSPISQTDRTRLRSLLILATDRLEMWLEDHVQEEVEVPSVAPEVLGIRQRFDDIFHLTLAAMGELQGNI